MYVIMYSTSSSLLSWIGKSINGIPCLCRLSISATINKEPSNSGRRGKKPPGGSSGNWKRTRRGPMMSPYKVDDVNMISDWSSLYQAQRPYDPYIIPLPIRMGRPEKGKVPPPAVGNLELMKIPNFFHLTPIAIQKHCKALKPLCTPWPDNLPQMPLKIETRNYVFPGTTVRHPGARKVTLNVRLSDLMLTDHARNKMILLAGHCYNPDSSTIRLVGKRCPTRKQNQEYVMYLLKVLYLESNRVEPWELSNDEECAG
ncbi:small ribosomal subunit protein mS35-like [Halichondria panicea]|uniref:small ribosomal subunit protein mS35-like n=1 Tax=Halichondria panicea TaxID=6063 RepID=UPI00312B4A36